MKILVYTHDMAMGGSQLNAIELAAAVRDRGHEVAVIGQPGALQSKIAELDLEFVELPRPGHRPSPSVVRTLRQLVRDRGIDIVHGYEWPPALEAMLACARTAACPVVTVLSMSVAPFIPRHLPLMVGTEQIAFAERAKGRRFVRLMEPPVDVDANDPDLDLSVALMAAERGVHRRGITVTVVSRLAYEMKFEGIVNAIKTVGTYSENGQIQLLIVGSGPAHKEVSALAEEVNSERGEPRIILTGEIADPRWAYSVADVVLGMGGSALRGMAMGKPLIVQGERGFWKTLNPESLDDFLWHGWYGVGPGKEFAADNLKVELEPLLTNAVLRTRLGAYARDVVHQRFTLAQAAERQIGYYGEALQNMGPRGTATISSLRGACGLMSYQARRVGDRIRGTVASDDFNAVPLIGSLKDPRGVGP